MNNAIRSIAILTIIAIPLAILAQGFFPDADALHHAAKVISGKGWEDILLIRKDMTMDAHPGWQRILSLVRSITDCGPYSLVIFSSVFLFVLFSAVPALFMRRPEAWIIALMIMALANPSVIYRFLLGRPYIVTMCAVIALGFLWPRIESKKPLYKDFASAIALFTFTSWMHCGWYLALPLAAFFLSGKTRAAIRLTACAALGVILGTALTGHPYIFLRQTFRHIFLSFGNHVSQRVLVGELQPFTGELFVVVAICLMLIWRHIRKAKDVKVIEDPIFVLILLCWAGGFIARRIWFDVGVAAASFWIASEFQDFFEAAPGFDNSKKRIFAAIAICAAAYLAITNDFDGRWSESHPKSFLRPDSPVMAQWLPGPGGIIYSDTNEIFYEMFFANPRADWRYAVGFEPGVMPPDELSIYRNIQMTRKSYDSFIPWVRKMRPQDRLIVRRVPGDPAMIPGLEWCRADQQTWIGRTFPKDSR